MHSGHPILDEIKKGFKLRPTKTVDKSKPVIYAEGEDEDEVAPTKRAPPSGILAPGQTSAPAVPPSGPKVSSMPNGWMPPPRITPGAIPPPPPMLGGIPPPPPALLGGGIPPPPPMFGVNIAPPPPPPQMQRPKSPLNPALAKLGQKPASDVDRGELLKGIQGGFKLRKTVTNDKSGLVVDDDMREKSVTLVERAPPTYVPPTSDRGRSPVPQRPHSSLGFDSSDDRFTSSYYKPPVRDDSPEQLLGQRRPIVMRRKGEPPPPPPEFGFDSQTQKITTEDLNKEIKKGSVASKMAALMGNMGFSQDQISQTGSGGTIPRSTFRPSPLRSSFMSEVNNNKNDEVKPKPVSKWAPVDTNYGLKKAVQGNVPMDREERAISMCRDRSSSWLDQPRPNVERARTQSPTPYCEREEEPVEVTVMPEPVVEKPPAKKTVRKKVTKVPEPISVTTDFSSPASKPTNTPIIQETPPTPAGKKSYSYSNSVVAANNTKGTSTNSSNLRSTSPAAETMSPISTLSSAPSPSSLSAGSVSPSDSAPKKKLFSNSAFEKTKEKWGAAVEAEETIPNVARPYLLKETVTPERTPERSFGSTTSSAPKKASKEQTAAAKGAAAVAKASAAKNTSTRTSPPKHSPSPPTNISTTKTVATTGTSRAKSTTPAPTDTRTESTTTSKTAPKSTTPEASESKEAVKKTTTLTKKPSYGEPTIGTVRDRSNKFRESLKADEDKGTKTSARQQSQMTSQVVNVPIYAPWHQRQTSTSSPRASPAVGDVYGSRRSFGVDSSPPSPTRRFASASHFDPPYPRKSLADVDAYSMHPSQLRDAYRFDISLARDVPVSIARR